MATPIAPPTWRMAISSAEPTPLRSAESAPSAASMQTGIAKPSPAPSAAIHAAAKP